MITTKKQVNVTSKIILKVVSAQRIFKYYSKIEPDTLSNSPIRNEKEGDTNDSTPSFIYGYKFGEWRFKDFGTNKKGNCFEFVKCMFNCTYSEALNIIANDFNIDTLIKNKEFVIINDLPIPSTKTKIIKVKTGYWNSTNIKYWFDYGISLKTLKYYEVYPLLYYWINTKRFICKDSYVYKVGINKFKILNLLRPKKYKWISNLKSKDWQGYHQLPKEGKLLIITKSLKDIMVLHELGYNSVAPPSENSELDKDIMNSLKMRFEEVIVFFDNDKAGLAAMERVNLPYIFIPLSLKDISDYSFCYGIINTKNFMLWLLHKK